MKRSEAPLGPASARSMVLRVEGGGVPSGDFTYCANRDKNDSAHPQTYSTGVSCKVGSFRIYFSFFADPNGEGYAVGEYSEVATTAKDGTLPGTITPATAWGPGGTGSIWGAGY